MSARSLLILASQSPRRHELLLAAGIEHRVQPASIDETALAGESPQAYVQRLAREKSAAVPCGPDDVVLGADTVVVLDDEIFVKPADRQDAAAMLARLSGRSHSVLTGICLRTGTHQVQEVQDTVVTFAPLSSGEIEEYLDSGEYADKAGAYAIQGLASKFITRIAGCYFNVVGLPIPLVYCCLKRL